MKKVLMTLLVTGLVSVPLAAQDAQPQAGQEAPAVQQGHEAFAKARQEHRAKLKATQEKMAKLVKEYNKLKAGKKKDAKRAEIEKEVAAIHEEQLKFKADQLVKFEERLTEMKTRLSEENTAEAKKTWVDQKTQQLIDNEGDVKALFEPRPGMHMHGPRGHEGFPGKHGPRFGKKHGPRPPADELPVQHPAEK